MIARKISPYMVVPFLMAVTPGARADEAAAPSDGLTIGVGGKYAPRYSGSDKQSWQVVPVLQGRKGAFFIDSQKGIGYDWLATAVSTSSTRSVMTSGERKKTQAGAMGRIR